tara:strand:- start:21661 stop:23253 length:1593 start_codon:yes stop_codon:yes gene_type:complete
MDVSKNLTFFILGLTAAVVAYIFNPALVVLVEMVSTATLPRDFLRMVSQSSLVAFGGYLSLFGLVFFLLYLVFPVTYVWYHISAAHSAMTRLPLASAPARRTTLKDFLSQMKEMGFIGKLAEAYSGYLVQEAERKVDPEVVKSARLSKRAVKSGDGKDVLIAPVRATARAKVLFNRDSLVGETLLLGFFPVFARLLIGAGVVCVGFSLVSYSLDPAEMHVMTALQPGLVAFLYCLTAAIIIFGGAHFVEQILDQGAKLLARTIDGLFDQNEWQGDMNRLVGSLAEVNIADQLEEVLHKGLDKPMTEFSKAVKELSSAQEEKLDGLMVKSLADFSQTMTKQVGVDADNLNKALKDATLAADKMKKQQLDGAMQFTKQMDKQAATIAKHLLEMQKNLKASEKTTHTGTEKLIAGLTTEVEKTYQNMAEFVESNLKTLQEKQDAFEASVQDKDNILSDLHNTARDLGTISNASGKLLDKFNQLTTEMDTILRTIQEKGPVSRNGAAKNNKLKDALLNLRQSNSERTRELPDME